MNKISITPEESITIIQALEYLAYGLDPYKDDDIIITNPKVLDIRKDKYFLNDDKMKTAKAQLEYFIRNRQINLKPSYFCAVLSNSYNSEGLPLVVHPNSYRERPLPYRKTYQDILDKGEIKSAQIKFIKMDENDSIPSYLNLDKESIIQISSPESNCHYIPICIVDYGFSLFLYSNCKGVIKFSELKSCCNEMQTENTNKVINDDAYSTPLIQLVNDMVQIYGDKINIKKKNDVIGLIKERGDSLGYSNFSQNDLTAVFRVIRHPETKKGGAKPQGSTPSI